MTCGGAARHPPAARRNTNRSPSTCPCGRSIRVAASTLTEAPITCQACDGDFQPKNHLTLKRQPLAHRRTHAHIPRLLHRTRGTSHQTRHGAAPPAQDNPAPACPSTFRKDVDVNALYRPRHGQRST